MPSAVPSGIRAVLAENLICSALDLSAPPATIKPYPLDMRRTASADAVPAKNSTLSLRLLAVPNYDNMFAGSNEDAEDFDDYNVIQRDLKVDGGLRPVREEDVIAIRNKAARALQAVFAGMGLPPITDEEVEAATYAHGSKICLSAISSRTSSLLRDHQQEPQRPEVVKAPAKGGFPMSPVTCSIFRKPSSPATTCIPPPSLLARAVLSAVNDVNDYAGPATGYRLQGEREEIKNIPGALDPNELG